MGCGSSFTSAHGSCRERDINNKNKESSDKNFYKIAGMYFANIVKGKEILQTSSRFKETKMT